MQLDAERTGETLALGKMWDAFDPPVRSAYHPQTVRVYIVERLAQL